MTAPATIAILGAGPSGLALARLLENASINYVVFERDESEVWSIGRGGTLDLHVSSGQLAVREAGLWDEFKALARYEVPVKLADLHGKIYINFGEGVETERPEIDRKDLRAMFLKSIPAGRIHWGKRVQQVQRDADGTTSVHFADGSVESGFRLVVGADGAWSKVRSLVTSAKPQYSGLQFLTTAVQPGSPVFPAIAALAGEGNYSAFGEGKQIAAQKLGDGSYYIAAGLRLPENWSKTNAALFENPPELRQHLLQNYFPDWPEMHTDFIRYSDGDFRAWSLYAMPTESLSWETVAGVTLIGDAAHVTTPFVGEGVNCALFDSVQLAQQIIKYGIDDLNKAVSEYEKLMFPRGIDLISRSEESGKFMFAEDAPRGWLEHFAGIKFE